MLPIDPIARTVLNMMRTRGGDAVMTVSTGAPTYDPATSTVVAPPAVNYPVRVLVFDYIKKTDGMGTTAGSLIQTGDKQMFMQPTPGLPTPKAKQGNVTFAGVTYDIITVKSTDPSGTNPILYELFIRE